MDKRTKILLSVLGALIVLAGGYYAYVFMTAGEDIAAVATAPAVPEKTAEPAPPAEAAPAEAQTAEAQTAEAVTPPAAQDKPAESAMPADQAAKAAAPAMSADQAAKAAASAKPEAKPAEAAKPGDAKEQAKPAPCVPAIRASVKGKPAEFKTPEEFMEKSGMDEKSVTEFSAANLEAARKKTAELEKSKAPKEQLDCAKKELEMADRLAKLVAEKFPKKPEKEIIAYSSLDKRDPFMSPDEIPRVYPKVPANAPPLERVPAEQLSLQGVMWNAKGFRALIVTPDGRGYTVKVGDRIGNKHGKVAKITEKRVYIEERIPDIFGDIEVRSTIKDLHKEAE